MSLFASAPAPVHRDAHATLLICILVGLVGLLIWWPIAVLGFACAGVIYVAFRDPPRIVPQRDGLVVSPADGYVLSVGEDIPPAELEMGDAPCRHVAISIGFGDVHINRVPIGGVVERISYRPGLFLNPTLDKASEFNERQAILVRTSGQGDVAVVQIAGILARRIVATVVEGDQVHTGERFGLIRFGSRVDVYLPQGASILVEKGQRMVAGETVIADFQSAEGNRVGVEQ